MITMVQTTGVVFGVGWTIGLLLISVGLPGMTDTTPKRTDGASAAEKRSSRNTWVAVFGVAAALVGGGVILWSPRAGGMGDADSDLGAALIAAAVVPVALFALERRFASLDGKRQSREATLRLRQDARYQAEMLAALQQDLSGVDLIGRDLSRFYLRGKKLRGAKLENTTLFAANLSYAVLAGAYMQNADLEAALLNCADLSGADLTGASLRWADLSDANLRGDTQLSGANLANARLDRADLRGADLRRVTSLSGCRLKDARHDPRLTMWPPHFDPEGRGAVALPLSDPWKSEGELKAGSSPAD
jgi:hypothetical protein